ncbi:MAG: T9SS type A sorting domain-containing protein [Flavobacteriales bacterium]|nr:T9SS type A sorting domain-containing protein [Flavobacteriales bacterium]
MKQLLLLATILFSFAGFSQCTADYDFQGAAFGVSPDPLLGESFQQGILNNPYSDVIHIMVPTSAADIDESFPATAPIDSLTLLGVSLVDLETDITYDIADLGLEVVCNNNGDSPDPCTFYGGSQYCASLEGTPNQIGDYQLIISVLGYTTAFGIVIPQQVDFDQYTYQIVDIADNVNETASTEVSLMQNSPNPFNGMTTIGYTLPQAQVVKIEVVNLLGEVVWSHTETGRIGSNKVTMNGSCLDAGIYLYSLTTEGKTLTKRLVINN